MVIYVESKTKNLAHVVGRAVTDAVLQARAGEPDAEAVHVVVAPRADDAGGRLGERRAAELRGEQDERVVQHAALAQVAHEGGDGPVDAQRLLRMVGLHVLVAVPVDARRAERAAGEELDEPHALLEQPPRQEATPAELRRLRSVEAVEILDAARLARQVRDARHRELHPRGEFVITTPRVEVVARAIRGDTKGFERPQQVAAVPLGVLGDRACREEVVDGRAARPQGDALVTRGQEAVAPVDRAARRHPARVGQDDVGGQVVCHRAEAVTQPRAHDREAVEAEAGVLLERRGGVVRGVGDHRVDDRQLVGDARDVREQVRDPQPVLAAPGELPVVLPQQADLAEERLGLRIGGHLLAVELGQHRLVVE